MKASEIQFKTNMSLTLCHPGGFRDFRKKNA